MPQSHSGLLQPLPRMSCHVGRLLLHETVPNCDNSRAGHQGRARDSSQPAWSTQKPKHYQCLQIHSTDNWPRSARPQKSEALPWIRGSG